MTILDKSRQQLKSKLKNPEMLTTWAKNTMVAPTHPEKCSPSPKHVFLPSS
jgi:hypothetical protein